jgi:hypothetical protein
MFVISKNQIEKPLETTRNYHSNVNDITTFTLLKL